MLLLLALAACSASPSRDSVPGRAVPPAVEKSKPATVARPAADLIQQGRQARVQGDYQRAQGLLQRAQRIDSQDAQVYLELSLLYSAQGLAEQARTMAERGLLYCASSTCTALRKQL